MNWLAIKEQADIEKGSKCQFHRRRFNEAKLLLSNMYVSACKFQDTTIDVNDTSLNYPLPANTKHVRKVRDEDSKPVLTYSVDILAETIRFVYVGTYTVTCAFETSDIVGADGEIPQISSVFHYAMAKFIAAKELEYSRPDRSNELLAEFYSEIAVADKSRTTARKGRLVLPSRRSY